MKRPRKSTSETRTVAQVTAYLGKLLQERFAGRIVVTLKNGEIVKITKEERVKM